MLFFMDLNGNVKRIDSAKIYQGSNDAGQIQLVTPITPINTAIQVGFTLPSGLVTTYYPMAVVGRYSLAELTNSDFVSAPMNTQVYLWQLSVPENVTADNGTVIATFQLTKPANILTFASRADFPTVGEQGVYYVVLSQSGNIYYKWNAENGTYATQGVVAYADEQTDKAIGRVAENMLTTALTDSVRTATDVQVVGENSIVYEQTSLSSSITLDFFPNTSTIVVGAKTVDNEELTATFEYYATTNAVLITASGGTAHSFWVTYSLEEQTVTRPLFFKTSDCSELQGDYDETAEDSLSIVNGVYVQVATSPCPFAVEYAPLPSIPTGGISEDEVAQILALMGNYYNQNAYLITEINKGTFIGQPSAEAETLPPGSQATAGAEVSDGHLAFSFGIPQGIQGPKGEVGPQGESGKGLIAMQVENGDLIAYTEDLQNVDFAIGQDGYMRIFID